MTRPYLINVLVRACPQEKYCLPAISAAFVISIRTGPQLPGNLNPFSFLGLACISFGGFATSSLSLTYRFFFRPVLTLRLRSLISTRQQRQKYMKDVHRYQLK
jgi:hypothetical protein